ncbi:MAG: DUF4293 domain-containing protein [Bacteroidales bacterium]|nr:DUF4293 domain-containing protein [Bacteroidales bacterium]
MIQRIQSVFLVLAIISTVLLFFFPIAMYYGDYNTIKFFIFDLKDSVPDSKPLYNQYFVLPLLLLNLAAAGLSFYALISFKTMRKQMQMIKYAIFSVILLIAAVFFFYTDHIAKTVNVEAKYEFGVFLPLITLVFLVLATRSIQRDINLIRSADRLR